MKFSLKFLPTICLMVLVYCLTLYFKCKFESKSNASYHHSLHANTSDRSIVLPAHDYTIQCHKFLFDYM